LGDEKELRRIFENIIKTIRYDEANLIDDIDLLSDSLGLNPDILAVRNLKKLSKTSNLDAIFDEVFGIIKKIKSLGIDADEFLNKTYKATEDFTSVVLDTPFGLATRDDYVSAWEQHYRCYVDEFCCFDEKKSGAFDSIAGKKQILDKNRSQKADKWTCSMGMESVLQKTKEQELYLTQVVALIYAVYQNELSKLDMVDFDDLINKTIKLFKTNPSLRAYYKDLFSHLIIDEFQDSNGAQLELIELLLSDVGPNITFVGDRKQSIYGFRFAQMENLDVLHKYIEQKY
jgi:ATP-dependent exoDNAse (exonuclease V) beta subunit